MSFTSPPPRSIITLKIADERDKRIYVAETPEAVRAMVNGSLGSLVVLTRWRAGHLSEFNTRPDNVVNVAEYT